MKAIEILDWICRESIEGELLNIVDVPSADAEEWDVRQDDEWWYEMFGACPPYPVSEGKYLYFYTSSMRSSLVEYYLYPDAQIEIPFENGFDYINFYKLED